MDKPIGVGDLVMVVRWPHSCINPKGVIGTPFRVTGIEQGKDWCARCGKKIERTSLLSALGFDRGARIPVEWLKRIDPEEELDDVEREEEIHA